MDGISLKLILISILVIAAVILVLMMFFQKKRRRRSTRSRYIDALYALIDGKRDEALKLLTEAVRNGETDIDAYIQLGNLLREKNQPEKALQIHRSLTVRRDMGYEEEKSVQLALAEDLADLGKMDRAIAALDSINKRRKDPDIARMLHRLYHRNGDHDNAFSMLKALAGMDPSINSHQKAAYLASVGFDYFTAKEIDRASQYLKKALKEDPGSIPGLFLAGTMAMEAGENAKAAGAWNELLKKDFSFFKEVIPRLEKCLFEAGRYDDLENILVDLSAIHDEEQALNVELASYYIKKGDTEKGLSLLEDEKVEHQKKDPCVTGRIASLFLESGHERDARRVLDENMPLHDDKVLYNCPVCGSESMLPREYCSDCSTLEPYIRKQ